MSDFRDLGKCGKKKKGYKVKRSSSHCSVKLNGSNALEFLDDICNLSKSELEEKFGDLSKLTGYLGDAE